MASSLHYSGLMAVLSLACGGVENQPEADETGLIVDDTQLIRDVRESYLIMKGGVGSPLEYSWEPSLPQPYARPFCVVPYPWNHPWICGSIPPCVSGGTPITGQPTNYRQISGADMVVYRVLSFPAHLYLAYHIEVVGGPVFTWLGISWANNGQGRSYSSSNIVVLPKGTHRVPVALLLTRSATATTIESIYVMTANGQGRALVAITGHDTCE